MKQIYHPYWLWECFKNGMWRREKKEYEETELIKIIEFTGNHNRYGESMIEAVRYWKYSCENFLSNKSINRRAYIGHAGCCIRFGWPEYLVREAWGMLTDNQRYLANKEADKAIKKWELEKKYTSMLKSGNLVATQMEFQMKCLQS